MPDSCSESSIDPHPLPAETDSFELGSLGVDLTPLISQHQVALKLWLHRLV